jgi:hypothetical protein
MASAEFNFVAMFKIAVRTLGAVKLSSAIRLPNRCFESMRPVTWSAWMWVSSA